MRRRPWEAGGGRGLEEAVEGIGKRIERLEVGEVGVGVGVA